MTNQESPLIIFQLIVKSLVGGRHLDILYTYVNKKNYLKGSFLGVECVRCVLHLRV